MLCRNRQKTSELLEEGKEWVRRKGREGLHH